METGLKRKNDTVSSPPTHLTINYCRTQPIKYQELFELCFNKYCSVVWCFEVIIRVFQR